MTPKERRDRLFKHSKPTIVIPLSDDQLDKEFGWMWIASHHMGGKDPRDKFIDAAMQKLYGYYVEFMHDTALVDDVRAEYPVGVFHTEYDQQWTATAHVDWYPWATTRNKLRCTVAWLQRIRWNKQVGIVLFQTREVEWFKGLKKYIPNLIPCGHIKDGFKDGDSYFFCMRGKQQTVEEMKAEMAEA